MSPNLFFVTGSSILVYRLRAILPRTRKASVDVFCASFVRAREARNQKVMRRRTDSKTEEIFQMNRKSSSGESIAYPQFETVDQIKMKRTDKEDSSQ